VERREPTLNAIRFNLTAYREKNKITQVELAELLGVNQCTVSYYERNSRHIKNSTILQIAETLNINPLELFINDDGKNLIELGIQVDFFPDDYKLER
jgi:transcriptional regulator with XRE-family HTH domain